MNKLKEFYSSFGFLITFMFLSVLISALFGEKFLSKFLLLILTSQILFNVDKVENIIEKLTLSNKQVNQSDNDNLDKKILGDIKNGKLVTNTIIN